MEKDQFTKAFGLHLTADAYECDRTALNNLGLIYGFLETTPDIIGMTKIMPPYAFRYIPPPGKPPEDWGISGFVLIAESHIAIHTFPDQGFLTLDIFSCKSFDHALALRYAQGIFRFQKVEDRLQDRGLEFPRNPALVVNHLRGERRGFFPRGRA